MSAEVVRSEHPDNDYSLVSDETSGLYTATIEIGDVRYSVTPMVLDRDVLLSDRRRMSRTSFIEDTIGTEFEDAALLNRAILLTAMDGHADGILPDNAWGAFRVAATLRHDKILKALYTRGVVGGVALAPLQAHRAITQG